MPHKEAFTKQSAIIQPLFEDEMWEYDEPGPQLAHLSLWEYMLVLTPPDEIWKRVMTIKKSFAEAYNYPFAVSTKPHITLANFLQFRLIEERVQEQLQKITTGLLPAEIALKDFASFSFSAKKAIYINIAVKEPILQLVKELKRAKPQMTPTKSFKPQFTKTPHLTIARSLPSWQYEKAWMEYQHAIFRGSFSASHVTMLRRPLSGKKFEVAGTFDLLGEGSDNCSRAYYFKQMQ